MNRLLRALGIVSLLFVPAAVHAQGLKEPSGAYFGGHVGFASDRLHYAEPAFPPFVIDARPHGLAGGVVAGFDHRNNGVTFGVEGDFGTDAAEFKETDTGGNGYTAIHATWTAHVRSTIWFGSGDLVPFVAIGAAVAHVKVDDVDPGFGHDQLTQAGWTFGGGVQCAMTDRVAVRAEYLYDDYGKDNYTIPSPPGQFFPSYVAQVTLRAHIVRAAVMVRF